MYDPNPTQFVSKIAIDPKIRRRVDRSSNRDEVRTWPLYENLPLKAGELLWSDRVYVPSEVVELVLMSVSDRELSEDEKSFALQYAGSMAWRNTRGCYRFEPEFERELMDQTEMPQSIELLNQLPAQCVVISVGGVLQTFVYFDYDINARQLQLCQIGLSRGGTFCFKLPIVGPLVSDMLSPANASPQQIKVFGYLMPQILHLCSLGLNHSAPQAKPKEYLVTRTGVIAC